MASVEAAIREEVRKEAKLSQIESHELDRINSIDAILNEIKKEYAKGMALRVRELTAQMKAIAEDESKETALSKRVIALNKEIQAGIQRFIVVHKSNPKLVKAAEELREKTLEAIADLSGASFSKKRGDVYKLLEIINNFERTLNMNDLALASQRISLISLQIHNIQEDIRTLKEAQIKELHIARGEVPGFF